MTASLSPDPAQKRFFSLASVIEESGTFVVLLDGKIARTRARLPLAAPAKPLADEMAAEWNQQRESVDFLSMPITRFQMTAIDRGAIDAGDWRRATLDFLGADLVCYRASSPKALADRQSLGWDPLLCWASSQGIALKKAAGLSFIEQPAPSLEKAARLLNQATACESLAIKSAAETAGSAVIALALWRRAFDPQTLFEASRIDERFQAEQWGRDADAEAREQRLKSDFLNVSRYLSLIAAG